MTRKGARRLIAALAPVSDPIDHLMNYYERHRIPYGETRPLFVGQGRFPSNVATELQALSDTTTAPTTRTLRGRRQQVSRGLVRAALAARLIARARLRRLFGRGLRPRYKAGNST